MKINNISNKLMKKEALKLIKKNPIFVKKGAKVTIVTANTKNKFFFEANQESTTILDDLVDRKINIIGTQELLNNTKKQYEEPLSAKGYNIVGNPRYGIGIIGKIADIAKGNETNSIVTNQDIVMSETKILPWLPKNANELKTSIKRGSIMPRVATHAILAVEDMGYVHQYNTHIDYGVPEIQHRQLEALLSFIDANNKDINLPTIITGDFNMTSDNDNMKWFLSELEMRDINMLPVDFNTYKGKYDKDGNMKDEPSKIDYVFISKDFIPKNISKIENARSDHDLIYAELEHDNNFKKR